MDTRRIAYYISAHGYGHGVRSTDILRALNRARAVEPIIVTALPESFLRNRLPGVPVKIRSAAFDVGMVQRDSIRVNVEATRKQVEALCAQWDNLVEQEAAWLHEERVGLVVCDIPAIPLEAAHRAGLPGLAVGNFSWDWIYGEFAELDATWGPLIGFFERAYGQTDLLLRLPFADEMRAFPRKVDIPLVACPGHARRAELGRATGADVAEIWVLLSFTALEWDDASVRRVEQLDGYEFFTVQPLEWRGRNLHAVNREVIPFSDVLASVDIVVSKPGFGLVSECIVNRKPLVYADRTDFREYAILVREMRRYLSCVHIPSDRLYRGDLADALEAALRQPPPTEILPADGGASAAEHILRWLS